MFLKSMAKLDGTLVWIIKYPFIAPLCLSISLSGTFQHLLKPLFTYNRLPESWLRSLFKCMKMFKWKKTRSSNHQNLIKDLICSTSQPNGFYHFPCAVCTRKLKSIKSQRLSNITIEEHCRMPLILISCIISHLLLRACSLQSQATDGCKKEMIAFFPIS